MKPQNRIWIAAGFAFIALLTVTAPAQNTPDAAAMSFPYVAKVVGQDVYLRSGPGTAYYFTDKLNEPAEVIVVGEKYGWLQVVPPAGSFSWISKRYVNPEPGNANIGIVSGDAVRVYAGSPNVRPRNSSSLQTKLNEGEQVRLLGDEMDDYYKIQPPSSAHLWISEKFLQYVGPLKKKTPEPAPEKPVAPKPQPDAEVKPAPTDTPAPEETKPAAETPAVPGAETVKSAEEIIEQIDAVTPQETPASAETPADEPAKEEEPKAPSDAEKIAEVLEIEKQINAVVMKNLNEQDYNPFKDRLAEIVNTTESEKARRYAEFLLDRIGRYELALQSADQVLAQDEKLRQTLARIESERRQRINRLPDTGGFIVVGTLQESHVYTGEAGEKRYVVFDDNGMIVCYAVPARELRGYIELSAYLGKKVGLKGTANADEITPSTVVEFTAVANLN